MAVKLEARSGGLPPLAWYGGSWAYSDPKDPPPPELPEPREERARRSAKFSGEQFGPELPPGQGNGILLGRFMPPHQGHQYLVDFASAFCSELTLFIRVAAEDPIPGDLRASWLRELFPSARVVSIADDRSLPDGRDSSLSEHWARVVREQASGADYLFTSEEYGADFAARIGATHIPFDPQRTVAPVSGSSIRRDPMAHWPYLPAPVRAYYVRRVCLIGPECSGKTTLARQLAERYGTTAAPEYARLLTTERGADWSPGETQVIARGQIAVEAAMARRANRLLICDTDVLAVMLWCERLFGMSPQWLAEEVGRTSKDLYLLTEPDFPYSGAPAFNEPDARQAFAGRCAEELEKRGLPFVRVRGSADQRLAQAVEAVDRLVLRKA